MYIFIKLSTNISKELLDADSKQNPSLFERSFSFTGRILQYSLKFDDFDMNYQLFMSLYCIQKCGESSLTNKYHTKLHEYLKKLKLNIKI